MKRKKKSVPDKLRELEMEAAGMIVGFLEDKGLSISYSNDTAVERVSYILDTWSFEDAIRMILSKPFGVISYADDRERVKGRVKEMGAEITDLLKGKNGGKNYPKEIEALKKRHRQLKKLKRIARVAAYVAAAAAGAALAWLLLHPTQRKPETNEIGLPTPNEIGTKVSILQRINGRNKFTVALPRMTRRGGMRPGIFPKRQRA